MKNYEDALRAVIHKVIHHQRATKDLIEGINEVLAEYDLEFYSDAETGRVYLDFLTMD